MKHTDRLKTIFLAILLIASVVTIPFTIREVSRLTVHNFAVHTADGQSVDLDEYQGTVLLIVNVATGCGLTPQFARLQTLYTTYRGDGFAVLGFPSNSFNQEPRTDDEILRFCSDLYLVDFPLFHKVEVTGNRIHPLFEYLTSESHGLPYTGPIRNNFEKFLVGKNGKLIARFAPEIEPDDPEIIAAVERALGVKR